MYVSDSLFVVQEDEYDDVQAPSSNQQRQSYQEETYDDATPESQQQQQNYQEEVYDDARTAPDGQEIYDDATAQQQETYDQASAVQGRALPPQPQEEEGEIQGYKLYPY